MVMVSFQVTTPQLEAEAAAEKAKVLAIPETIFTEEEDPFPTTLPDQTGNQQCCIRGRLIRDRDRDRDTTVRDRGRDRDITTRGRDETETRLSETETC